MTLACDGCGREPVLGSIFVVGDPCVCGRGTLQRFEPIVRHLSFPLDTLPPSPLPHAIDRTVGWEGLGLDKTPRLP